MLKQTHPHPSPPLEGEGVQPNAASMSGCWIVTIFQARQITAGHAHSGTDSAADVLSFTLSRTLKTKRERSMKLRYLLILTLAGLLLSSLSGCGY
ncbi:MAG TPA: hypothetical protein VGA63_10680, partial [Geopsychrobacteraceae bacterium]